MRREVILEEKQEEKTVRDYHKSKKWGAAVVFRGGNIFTQLSKLNSVAGENLPLMKAELSKFEELKPTPVNFRELFPNKFGVDKASEWPIDYKMLYRVILSAGYSITKKVITKTEKL